MTNEKSYRELSCNEILFSLLGSQELVLKWWDSPNKAFDGKTPRSMCLYKEGTQSVIDYLRSQLSGEYS